MLIVLLAALWLVLQLSVFQTFLAQSVASFLSKELDNTVKIERLEVDFFNTVDLKKVYISDQKADTLLAVDELQITLGLFNIRKKFVNLEIELNQPHFNLYREKKSQAYNHDFFWSYFSNSDSSRKKIDWILKVKNLSVADGSFHYHDYHKADTTNKINYSHIDLKKFNLKLSAANLEDGNFTAKVNRLSAQEENGFVLNNLETELSIGDGNMRFKNTTIQTKGTELEINLAFSAGSFKDYQDFISSVKIEADIHSSLIHMDDVAFFAPPLDGIKNQVYLDGNVSGTIANLSGKDLEIHLNKETILLGNFDFRGLPDIQNTFIHFDVHRLSSSAKGLKKLPYPPFNEKSRLPIPANAERFGKVFFNGKFTGYYNDFVAFGTFGSSLGSVQVDMSVKEKNKQFYYEGELKSSGFEMGQLLKNKKMGKIALNIKVHGRGLSKEKINAKAEGTINSFEFANYNYKDIQVNAAFSQQTLDGKINIDDKNINLNFNGTIDASGGVFYSDFKIDIDNAKLANLNLFNQKDSLTALSLKGDINLLGFDFDEVEGALLIDSVQYQDSDHLFLVDSLDIIAEKEGGIRHLTVNSNLLNANMDGHFRLNELNVAGKNYLANYFKYQETQGDEALQDFSFHISLINLSPLTEVFLPELEVDSNTTLQGNFNNKKNQINLEILGEHIQYQSSVLKSYQFQLHSDSTKIKTDLKVKNARPFGIGEFDSLNLNAFLSQGKMELNALWRGINQSSDSGKVNAMADFNSFDNIDFTFYNSAFFLGDELWEIVENNHTTLIRDSVMIDQLRLKNKSQFLAIDGILSKNPADSLKIKLNQLNLEYLSKMLPKEALNAKGVASGNMVLKDVYNNLSLTSNLSFDSLVVNTIDIGSGYFESKWNAKEKVLLVDGEVGEKQQNILTFGGKVYPLKSEESLDLKVRMNQFPLYILSPYIDDYLSDIQGYTTGAIEIKGEANKPLLRGRLQLRGAEVTVNLLNTHYKLENSIIVEPDFIGFNQMEITDKNGSKAIATGTVFHNNYSDFSLDIGLDYQDFLALNTTSIDNDLYYGKAICSGNANISGFGDQFIIGINAKAEKGTDFKIPLDEGVEVSSSDFLIFTNSNNQELTAQQAVDLSGIQLNFDLEIEKEAEVKIIFDEKIGDILEAQGEGNLKLEINTLGNFNIFGQYVISDGEYLFTLKNIVNKRFSLARGSRISWDGDPYKAKIDMQAIYNLRASLVDIMGQDSTANFKRRVPVELELQMKGLLMSPGISFDIRLPTADDEIRRRLESILYVNRNDVNQQEMNRQVFGLLVFNRFMRASTGRYAETGVSRSSSGINNGYEFLSNQMSNWLSQVSDQFDVGVNYRQGDEYAGNEFDVSLSTELFEDRLIVDGNLGYTSDVEYIESQERSNFIGEFSLEYKLSKDGRFRLKGFNRSTNNTLLETNSPYTQGVGLFYREEFDTFNELWRRYFRREEEQ